MDPENKVDFCLTFIPNQKYTNGLLAMPPDLSLMTGESCSTFKSEHPEETYENYLRNTFEILNNQPNSAKSTGSIARQMKMKSNQRKDNKKQRKR